MLMTIVKRLVTDYRLGAPRRAPRRAPARGRFTVACLQNECQCAGTCGHSLAIRVLEGEHSQIQQISECMSVRTTQSELEHFPEPAISGPDNAPAHPPSSLMRQEKAAPGNPGHGVHLPVDEEDWSASVVHSGFNCEHRTGSIQQNALCIGPQDQLADRRASAQADHDEVCVDLVGHLDQVL